MAGFSDQSFSLFTESTSENKENSGSILALKSAGNLLTKDSVKLPSKSKGLSVRTESDLNVFVPSNTAPVTLSPKSFLTIQDKKIIFRNKKLLSPVKIKTPKSSKLLNLASKKLSPKILSPVRQNVVDYENSRSHAAHLKKSCKNLEFYKSPVKQVCNEFKFTKPTEIPRKSKKYPEPEKLCHDFDVNKFMDEEVKMTFNNDLMWLKSARRRFEIMDEESTIFVCEDPIMDSYDMDDYQAADISGLLSSSPRLSVQLPEIADSD